MIIIAEQSKIVYELENITEQVLIKYLKAVQKIHDEEAMYRVLWDGEHLLVDKKDSLRFLVHQAYQGKEVVHWSIVPSLSKIPYEILGLVAVKLLHTKQYKEFDAMIKDIYEDPRHNKAFDGILNEVEWWTIHVGDNWVKNTPYFQSILTTFRPSVLTLEQAVGRIISNDKFELDDDWEVMVRDVVMLTKIASNEEIETAVHSLSQYNWFRNWLIYLIRITELSQRMYSKEDIIDAFTFLVRDLEPFKGEPRVCDLYKQLPYIKKSFHLGLLLCKGDEELLTRCCELLEKVTKVTTSLQRSFSGPLTDEEYLEIISFYLPGEYVIDKYEEYYNPLGSRRVYADVAEIAFEYAHVLSSSGRADEAKQKYLEGIEALTAYGFRKDRTLSEVLDCSVPYQQAYGTLSVEWFYELYHMSMTVVTHTDGASTSSYPIEWFEEFIKAYPEEALRFLATETIVSSEANWHQEDEFYHILEEHPSLFSPTQWFLLCRSLPLASSNKIIANGLEALDKIDGTLRDVYSRWLQSLPYVVQNEDSKTYPQEIASKFGEQFGIHLEFKGENNSTGDGYHAESSSPTSLFPTTSVNDALAFLETNNLTENQATHLQQLFASITTWDEKKTILCQVAKSFRYGRDVGKWVDNLFEPESHEWLYFNVCLFVFITDGWLHGLHYTHYLKRAYEVDPTETISILKEILGFSLAVEGSAWLISCNLIKALSELQVEEAEVHDLLQTIFQIVKRRLPHPPNSKINASIYQGLEGLNRDEMVVALLIARLKTLTTEKTQGIIWSLTFIAQTTPKTLLKPYSWAFSHHDFLLPIHRAMLLQILKEYVDQSLIPDGLIGKVISFYPTGFFLEDQYIRSFVEYKIDLDEKSAKNILLASHKYDKGFFLYIHLKYRTLAEHFGPLTGTYKAYAYKRDKISKEHESYYIRTDNILTPIVSNANAHYEIVNSQYYDQLKELTYRYNPSYLCNLRFFLQEIILQVGALTRRPTFLPTPENFLSFEVRKGSSPFEHKDWVVLASKEKELYGERFKPKKRRESALVLTFGKEPIPGAEFYARHLFNVNQYIKNNIVDAPFDQPICMLTIVDTLEYSYIVYVSPFIIRELGLTIDPILHNGFQARNDKGEIIIKMVTWREDYYGSVNDGTEVPRLEGVGVMIRDDYYQHLLALYQKESWFILSQDVSKDHK